MGRVRSRCRTAALMAALAALLVCASADHASSATTGKITPSPKLVEAVESGEMTLTAFTAAPVDSSLSDLNSDSSTATTTTANATTAPAAKSTPVTAAPATSTTANTPKPSGTGETAVDTFQSKTGIADTKSGSSGAVLGVFAGVGCVAAIAMAVVYKRKSRLSDDDDDGNDSGESQAQHQSHTTTCSFENADYTPNNDSIDGMLQDDRTMAESIAMMPVFSAADRMDMSGGIVRLSSPFGASGVRISSPGGRGHSSADDFAFNVDPNAQRSGGSLAQADARGTASSAQSARSTASAAHTVVDVKPAGWL